jgi:glycosyltransferase involved in cell wall biosynthesis
MKISVVIATYNRRATLARTLPTVLEQHFPSEKREVIVVVDGSNDGTAQYLRELNSPCRLIIAEQPNRGPAAARNAGIYAATGELILLLDDDMLCSPGFVAGHAAAHHEAQPTVVFGPIVVAAESPGSIALNWFNLHQASSRAGASQSPKSKYRAWATNCSLPRSVLFAVGGYDERFLTHEDADLAIRLWEAGVAFRFCPHLAIEELYDKPPSTLVKAEARRLGRDEVLLCRKHPGYRPFSRAMHLSKGPLGSLFIRLASLPPASPEPLLRSVQSLAQYLPGGWGQTLAIQCFRSRMAIEEVRGMVEECGSWRAFVDCFGIGGRALQSTNGAPTASATSRETTPSGADLHH